LVGRVYIIIIIIIIICSYLQNRVHNGSGVHPAYYPIGTRGSFPEGKTAGAWSWPLTSI